MTPSAPPSELLDNLRRCRSQIIDSGKALANCRGVYLERGETGRAAVILLAQMRLQEAVVVLCDLLAEGSEGVGA